MENKPNTNRGPQGPVLVYDNEICQFALLCSFGDRGLPKSLGFRWNPELRAWMTSYYVVAKRAIEFADESAATELARVAEEFSSHKPCGRCGGTGDFVTMVVNGVPTGPGGVCFRCNGKGYQTPEDQKRNGDYDEYAFLQAARSMMS